uniref:Scavenger receptor class F member 2-like n=1 Tax=Crassostrea virginica TaxID=6565 RepID=A0A8B8AP74_CRAVI|nr:scavenger receptor class F member 2-like [Crassostrea virginica]
MACAPGFFGSYCNNTCLPGTYGEDCAGFCKPICSDERCHRILGCVESNTENFQSSASGEHLITTRTTTQAISEQFHRSSHGLESGFR